MALSQQIDSIEHLRLNFPYNRITNPLDDAKPRLFRGLNSFVTQGGVLARRPATIDVDADAALTSRPARLWMYETEESPPKVYFVASMYDTVALDYKMYWFRAGVSSGWTAMTALRGLAASSVPHEATVFHGKLYIRSKPTDTSDKYGTAIFDGTTGTPTYHYWGYPAPTEPVHISGVLTFAAEDIDDSETAIDVDDGSVYPGTPFVVQCEYEEMNCTNVSTNTLTVTRGYNGTIAEEHPNGTVMIYRDWSASDHRVDVLRTWKYVYAYVTDTDQVTSRSSLENNPDLMPSATGPFYDLKPKLTLVGVADTTRIPYINVYRSDDGGGTYYFLEQTANPGAGNFTYLDDSLGTGAAGTTYNDPLPDAELDQARIAPTLLSNEPPPPIREGESGVDNVEAGTRLIEYASRIWYAIGNRLFYSGDEEISDGNPQECFPGGTLEGNYFDFQFPVTNLAATADALYIFTLQRVYRLTGTNLETFNPRPLYDSVGAPYGHPLAICQYDRNIGFLAHDYRVCVIDSTGNLITLSEPLSTDLVDKSNEACVFQLSHWADLEKEYIIVSGHVATSPAASRHWVYDIKKSIETREHFWFTPWAIPSVITMSGRIAEDTSQRRLVFGIWDPTNLEGRLVRIDPTNRTDQDVGTAGTDIAMDFNAETSLFRVPPGNHVNVLRRAKHVPDIYGLVLERLAFSGDQDPDVYIYRDDLYTDPITLDVIDDPNTRPPSKGFKTLEYSIDQVGMRIGLKFSKVDSRNLIELYGFTVSWNPNAGL